MSIQYTLVVCFDLYSYLVKFLIAKNKKWKFCSSDWQTSVLQGACILVVWLVQYVCGRAQNEK